MPNPSTTPELRPQAVRIKDKKKRPRGRPTERVYSDPVKAHIESLLEDSEICGADIGRAAGVSAGTIRAAGTRVTMQRYCAEVILAVTPESARAARVMVDVTPAREHLLSLLQCEDVYEASLAAASGMDPRQINEVLSGLRVKITPQTERILLGVTPYAVRRNAALVSPRRAITRLRALQANGHSLWDLGHRLGFTKSPFYLGWPDKRITQETDRKAERLFHEIGDQPGTSTRAAAIARRMGYYPPIHYDEDMNLIEDSIPTADDLTTLDSAETRARTRLRIMGLTIKDYRGSQIILDVKGASAVIDRTRREIGLRLENNKSLMLDLPYIKPGQDELVAAVAKHTAAISLLQDVDYLDEPDLDYVALWDSLLAEVKRLRVASRRAEAA